MKLHQHQHSQRQATSLGAGYSCLWLACLFICQFGCEDGESCTAAAAAQTPRPVTMNPETRCKLFDVHFNGAPGPPLLSKELSGERTGFYITGKIAARVAGTTLLYQPGYRSTVDNEEGTGVLAASMGVWITEEGYLRASIFCGGAPSSTDNNVAVQHSSGKRSSTMASDVEAVVTSSVAITDGQEHSFRVEQASSRVRLRVDFGEFASGGVVDCVGIHWGDLHIGGQRFASSAQAEGARVTHEASQPVPTQGPTGQTFMAPRANFRGDLGSLRHRAFWIGRRSGTIDLLSLAQGTPSVQPICTNTTGSVQAAQSQTVAGTSGGRNEKAGCTSGVIYGFMDNSAMPLQAVWQNYFNGCSPGSFKIVTHANNQAAWQAASSAPFMQNAIRVKKPVPGLEMRFQFGMIEAMQLMMKLGDAETFLRRENSSSSGGSNAVDGARQQQQQQCRPQWMQFLSDSCLPITTCKQVHHFLERQPSHSFVNFRMSPPHEDNTQLGRVRCKGSQWVTLHQKDLHLFASELFHEAYWKRFKFAPDEYYFCTELRARQRRVRGRVMLYNEMPRPNPTGHAKWLNISDIRQLMSKQCINEPFVRKFNRYANVSLKQIEDAMSRELPICITQDPSLDTRNFEVW